MSTASHPLRWLIGAAVGALVVWLSWDASHLGDERRRWVVPAVVLVSVAVAELLPELRAALPEPGVLTALMLVPLAAIYGCVPETDQISDVVIVIVAVLAIEVLTRRIMGVGWHGLAAAMVMWAGLFGATGFDRAFVGALYAFWPVVVFGSVIRVFPGIRTRSLLVRLSFWVIGGVASLVVARTGALQNGRTPAGRDVVLTAAITAPVAFVWAAIVSRATPRHRRP